MKKTTKFRELIKSEKITIMPGVQDALTACIAAKTGFEVITCGGYSSTAALLGQPDTSQLTMIEMAEHYARICDSVDIPVFGDGDTGFGNALNVIRTVKVFEMAGANAIQLEDQTLPKRCGHLKGKSLVPTSEMVGKIKAAVDTRKSNDFLIIARTDSIAVEGFDSAIARAEQYMHAGADILFIEAPEDERQQKEIPKIFKNKIPLLANMVEGGSTPIKDASELESIGYSIVIFPGGLIRAFTHMALEYFDSLKKHGSNKPFYSKMLDFNQLNELLGTNEIINIGKKYD